MENLPADGYPIECNESTAIIYGDVFKYDIPAKLPAPDEVADANDGKPKSSGGHL